MSGCNCPDYVCLETRYNPCSVGAQLNIVADETGTWIADIEFNGMWREFSFVVNAGDKIIIPTIFLNELYEHELKIYNSERILINDTCYIVKSFATTNSPSYELPTNSDMILFFDTLADFPSPGAVNILYVDKETGFTYTWGGSAYSRSDREIVYAANISSFPITGDSNRLYITIDTLKLYRWGGSSYVQFPGGTTTVPGGTNGQLQYNNSGAFDGAPISLSGDNIVTALNEGGQIIERINNGTSDVDIRVSSLDINGDPKTDFSGTVSGAPAVNGNEFVQKNQVSGFESLINKKTNLSSPNNTDYPTTQAVANALSSVSSNLSKYAKATSAVVTYIQDRYQAFPAIAMDRDKYAFAECIWKDAPSHVADGNLKWCMSVDGFKTFTTPVTITVGGTPLTNATNGMIGFGRNGRSVIAYSTGGDLTTLYFAKCDNHSNEFTATTTMTLPSGIDFLFPFGKTIIMPGSGELRMLGYCKETALTPTSTCYFKSIDNGDSWTFGGIILHGGPMSGPTYFYPIGPSESDWDIVSTDETDAGTKILLIARDDVNYRHIQLFTNDGGLSWSNTIQTANAFAFGDTIPGTPDAFWPCTVLCYGGKAYAIHGLRMPPSYPQNFSTRLFAKDALTVYNNPNNWNPTTDFYTHYRPQSFSSYSYIDWGYPWIAVSPYGQLSAVLYDGDPRGAISVSIPPTIVIKAIDLENGNYFSTYASANQTIASGIETEITFDKPWLDSENSGHYIPSDGNYTVTFRCKISPDATGTYRQVSIYGISEGQENHVAGTGKTPYGQKVIAPSAVSQLNNIHIDCSGYFIAGTLVRPMIIHDASGNLTLDNSDPLTRATLSFKKID